MTRPAGSLPPLRHDVQAMKKKALLLKEKARIKAMEDELRKHRKKKKQQATGGSGGGLKAMKSIAARKAEEKYEKDLKSAIFQAGLPPRLRGNKFIDDPDPSQFRLDRPDRDAIRANERKAKARREAKAKKRRIRVARAEKLKEKKLALQMERWKYQNKIDRVERLKVQARRVQRWDFKKKRVTGLGMFKRYQTATRDNFEERVIRPFSPGHSHHAVGTFCLRWAASY